MTNPRVIGWDFPNISVEQMNVYHMHGYTAAWVLPVGIQQEGLEIKVQPKHRYAAVHVEKPFENPFVTIPSAYQALDSFMRVNGLVHTESGVIPCYETNGEAWISILRVSKAISVKLRLFAGLKQTPHADPSSFR